MPRGWGDGSERKGPVRLRLPRTGTTGQARVREVAHARETPPAARPGSANDWDRERRVREHLRQIGASQGPNRSRMLAHLSQSFADARMPVAYVRGCSRTCPGRSRMPTCPSRMVEDLRASRRGCPNHFQVLAHRNARVPIARGFPRITCAPLGQHHDSAIPGAPRAASPREPDAPTRQCVPRRARPSVRPQARPRMPDAGPQA